jgi:hypothetical protein
VHDVDALACECGARLRFVDLFTDPARARVALDALGLSEGDSEGTSLGHGDGAAVAPAFRARDPTADDDGLADRP